MTREEHRPGVTAANLVVRHLKLASGNASDLESALDEIDQLRGLDDISFDDSSQVLNVAYDAARVSVDGIEEILARHRIEVSHDHWTRFKEGYYRFVDQNIKDNALHQPHCCNKVPPAPAKGRQRP